jgi:hypothetical protein
MATYLIRQNFSYPSVWEPHILQSCCFPCVTHIPTTIFTIWPLILEFQILSTVLVLISAVEFHALFSKLEWHISLSRDSRIRVLCPEETLRIPIFIIFETVLRAIQSCICWALGLLEIKVIIAMKVTTYIHLMLTLRRLGFYFLCTFMSWGLSQRGCFIFAFNWISGNLKRKLLCVNLDIFSTERWDKEHLARCTKVSFDTVSEMQWKCQWLSR